MVPESTPRLVERALALAHRHCNTGEQAVATRHPRRGCRWSPRRRCGPSPVVGRFASPSKPPTVTRPHAARPGPAPSPSLARWNALPNRSSWPVISRVVVLPGAAVCMRPRPVPGQPPAPACPGPDPGDHDPGSGPGSSAAPSARATESQRLAEPTPRPPSAARSTALTAHRHLRARQRVRQDGRRPHPSGESATVRPKRESTHLLERVVVLDRPRRLAVPDPRALRVGQPEQDRLPALVEGVVEDRHARRSSAARPRRR